MSQIQVRDPEGYGVGGISIRIAQGVDKPADEALFDYETDPSGNKTWPIPYWPAQNYTLHVNVPGFAIPANPRFHPEVVAVSENAYGGDIVIRLRRVAAPGPGPDPIGPVEPGQPPQPQPHPPVTGDYPFPAEEGGLYVEGTTFRRHSDGSLFQWRGKSMFLLVLRHARGEDIRPDLHELRLLGVNVPRIFGALPWAETPDYRVENFPLDAMGQVLELLRVYGLRSEWSLAHYMHSGLYALLVRQLEILSDYPEALVEWVNEPHVGREKPDPQALNQAVGRDGTLAAYGYYGNFYKNGATPDPVLQWGSLHTTRDSSWARKARHIQELQHTWQRPTVGNEPAKIVEPGFSYPGGKNDPAKTPNEAIWYHAIAHLWTPGATFHDEEGKWGRVPRPGTLQRQVLEGVRDQVWTRIHAGWQTGEYNHSGNHDSPVDDVDADTDGDGKPDPVWTYTSLHASANRALSVRAYASEPRAINGWRVVEAWGPGNSIVRLER